jgi:hypothetical protein
MLHVVLAATTIRSVLDCAIRSRSDRANGMESDEEDTKRDPQWCRPFGVPHDNVLRSRRICLSARQLAGPMYCTCSANWSLQSESREFEPPFLQRNDRHALGSHKRHWPETLNVLIFLLVWSPRTLLLLSRVHRPIHDAVPTACLSLSTHGMPSRHMEC